jgi:hypothetical protein
MNWSSSASILRTTFRVGGIDIDSKWSTGVNNFIFDTTHFPNATLLIEQMHQLGVRVILWVTSVVDTDSSNHAEGLKNGYYLNDGYPFKWWHGWGSWIDCKCRQSARVFCRLPKSLPHDQIRIQMQLLGGINKWTMSLILASMVGSATAPIRSCSSTSSLAAFVVIPAHFRARLCKCILSRLSLLHSFQESRGIDLGASCQRLLAFCE